MAIPKKIWQNFMGFDPSPYHFFKSPWLNGSIWLTISPWAGHSLLFLIEAGQWMWPAVRLGFTQNVSGLPGVRLRTASLRPVILEVENFMTQQAGVGEP
jgi:hypothetical protein